MPSAADLLHVARDRRQAARDGGEEDAVLVLFAAALERREADLRRLPAALLQPAPARGRKQTARVEANTVRALSAEAGGRQQEAGGTEPDADWAPSTSEKARSNTDSALHPFLAALNPAGIMVDFIAFTRSAAPAVANDPEVSSPSLARATATTGAFAAAEASALARVEGVATALDDGNAALVGCTRSLRRSSCGERGREVSRFRCEDATSGDPFEHRGDDLVHRRREFRHRRSWFPPGDAELEQCSALAEVAAMITSIVDGNVCIAASGLRSDAR